MNTSEKHSIFILDDHAIVREGLAMIINQEPDMVVCGSVADGHTAIKKISEINPHVVIVDLSLTDVDGLQVIREMKEQNPDIILLVFSMREESVFAERCVKAGASGYVMKSENPSVIIDAIRRVLSDKLFFSESMTEHMLGKALNIKVTQHKQAKGLHYIDEVENLSDREFQVFQMLGNGFTSKQIAERLKLSIKTIDTFKENIKHKLSLKHSTEVTQYAIKWTRHYNINS